MRYDERQFRRAEFIRPHAINQRADEIGLAELDAIVAQYQAYAGRPGRGLGTPLAVKAAASA